MNVGPQYFNANPQLPSPFPDYEPPPFPVLSALPELGRLPPGFRLPFGRDAMFTGRETQLLSLAHDLFSQLSPQSALTSQVVVGPEGVGKTHLSVELAYRYGRFLYGVHWISAASASSIEAEIAACGWEMGLQGWPAEQPEQARLTRHVWGRGGMRLVILDNVEDAEVVQEWLHLLTVGEVRVLLTSRRQDWPRGLDIQVKRLDTFEPRESLEFLRRYRHNALEPDLRRLAETLGHLPLALALAGSYLDEDPGLSVSDYLLRLDWVGSLLDHESAVGEGADWGGYTGRALSLEATLRMSWDRVTNPLAQRLFRIAGWCAPNQPIPRDLLLSALSAGYANGSYSEIECRRALSDLVHLSLLTQSEADSRLMMHPRLSEYAQNQDMYHVGLSALTKALLIKANEANESGNPSQFAPLRPHVQNVAEAATRAQVEGAGQLLCSLGESISMG